MGEALRYDDRIDTQSKLSAAETFQLIGRALSLLKNVRTLFFTKLGFAVVSVIPPLIVPWILKIVVDQVVLQKPFDTETVPFPPFMMPLINATEGLSPGGIMLSVTTLLIITLILFGLRAPPAEQVQDIGMPQGFDSATQAEQALSSGGSNTNGLWGLAELLLTIRLSQRLANRLRTNLMGRLSRLEMTTLDDQRVGDSVYRVMYDAPMLPEICYRLLIYPLTIILSTAISIYLMQYAYFAIAPQLVWLAVGIIPLIILITAPMSGWARRLHQESRAAGAKTTNSIEESIENVDAVQSLGGSTKEAERFESDSKESYRRFLKTELLAAIVKIIAYSCATVSLGIAFVFITDDVITGVLTPGDYTVLFAMFWMLGEKARLLGTYWIDLQKNVAAVRRVFFFIDYTSEADRTTTLLSDVRRGVSLDAVSFAYPDGRAALSDINLELSLGELVAIVGPTGAGKTTLAYLLPGFLQPSAGAVRFDDMDISSVSVDDLRRQVTYVFQEHMLMSGSIRDNLLLANPLATEAEVVEACRLANAIEFIEQLPDGIDTHLGRSGDTLSVGQKQRLSIARGLIRKTPIIILDEPTAALDPQTENTLMAGLRQATHDQLVIVIAHRLSTIRDADRIIFLEEGRLVDEGNHDSLMADPDSRYRAFVQLQST